MVNSVIRHLVMSDFIIQFAFGLLSPIFAVFILKTIPGSTLRVIGTASACYWIARVISTVPLSRFMDKTDGERDEFYFSIAGSFIISSLPLFYLLMQEAWHLYLIQFIYGLANSMAVPAWRILFTDHLDHGRTGFEWSLEDVAIGLAAATSAYVGSLLADKFGFPFVLILLAMLGYLGTMFLIPLHRDAKTLTQIKREKRFAMMLFKRKTLGPPKVKN